MANAESEPDLFPAAREPPPRALTRLSPMVRRIVAPNSSPFTFNGTCTYIVGEGAVAIVDPGPDDDSHLTALLSAIEGEQVETILVTHTHRDHSVGANKLRAATGARLVGAAPFTPRADGAAGLDASHDRNYSPDAILADGERLHGSGYSIEAVATPGHCSNHFVLRASRGRRAVLRRSRHGLVDFRHRAPRRLDARLHGLARETAPAQRKDLLAWSRRPHPRTAAVSAHADPSPAPTGSLDPDRARDGAGRFPPSSPRFTPG